MNAFFLNGFNKHYVFKQQLWVTGVDIDIIEFAPLNVRN